MEPHYPGSGEAKLDERGLLRVRLLGGFRVSVGSRAAGDEGWRSRKARSLVKLLALAPGHRLHREQVLDLLWPDLSPEAGVNNLHYTLHVARRSLSPDPAEDSGYLCVEDDRLSLYPDGPLWIDIEAFRSAADMARRNPSLAAYRAAVERYTGELLPEDRYEDWAEEPRAELRNTYHELLVGLARLHEARGELGAALDALRRVVADTPEHEEAQTGLMRLYAASGQRYQALRQYDQLEGALRRTFGTGPAAASRRLYDELVAGHTPALVRPSSAGGMPAGPWDTERHNLPAPLTSLVGREREVEEIGHRLDDTRLLTLTGAGGCGKTRLALAAAMELVERYPDGAWLAELSPLSEPEAVTRAVAAVTGVHEQPGRPLLDTLLAELRPKRLLLVLDNCEHLIHPAARLAETLLRSCPGLTVLATSRETLGVHGEMDWTVQPLATPEPEPPADVEELKSYDSVRLFLDRARRQRPGFELTEENARAVAEICHRLDGIPLAVELAAARVGTLSVGQISARLDDALDLLTEGGRTAEPRQRTLRGALDWSHQLLEKPEQRLFRRLSVFAGGFTLEAAEDVGPGDGVDREKVLDLLSKLVDKSLVAVRVQEHVRYRLLQPIRRYALERLEQGGEAEQVRRRHAEWCLQFAETAERGLAGPDQPRWLNRLEAEHDNLRAALGRTLDGGDEDKELGLRISAALWLFWDTHGHLVEGRKWLEEALRENREDSTPRRAKALNGLGWILISQGEYDAAVPILKKSIAIHRDLGDEEGLAAALANLGFSAMFGMREDIDLPGLLEEASELRPRIKDHRTLGMLLIFAGLMREGPEAGQRGEALHEESLDLFRRVRDIWGMSTCLTSLGIMALRRGDHDRAAGCLKENLDISRGLDKKVCISYSFFGLASLAANQNSPRRAARLWAASESVREAAGIRLSPLARAAVGYEAQLDAVQAALGDEHFEAAWAEGRAMAQEEAIEYALETVRSTASPTEQPSTLTRREREVAELVARGLTNREISSELVISRRTAENHVARTLKKLGLGSRRELAAWVEKHSLPEERG